MSPKKLAKAPRKHFNIWTAYLMKEGNDTKEACLSDKALAAVSSHSVVLENELQASLFVKDSNKTTPPWVKHFKAVTPPVVASSKSAAAVMLVPVADRTFAVCFGHGRLMLRADSYEQDFGLKVVLNNIDPNQVRQVNLSGFDALLQNKQAQAVRNSPIDEFGMDVEQEVLKSISGVPKEDPLARQIDGRDSYRISTEIELESLPMLLTKILKDSEKKDYEERFPWIGRMKEVSDKAAVEKLDAALLEKIRGVELSCTWLAPPEYVDMRDGCRYQISNCSELTDDLRLAEIIEEWGETRRLNVALPALKQWRVTAYNDNDLEIEGWSIYRCLYCEIDSGKGKYILNDGHWYEVNEDYLAEVNANFDSFPESKLSLPAFRDKNENEYNIRVAASDPSLAMMDRKTVQITSRGLTSIEFCDLYKSDRTLIHVKRYGGSSELSHLFAQAIVSAELLKNEAEFRTKINGFLGDDHAIKKPADSIEPSDYNVVYAVISKSTNKLNLPFFSKIMLRHAKRSLTNMGFSVSLAKIDIAGAG